MRANHADAASQASDVVEPGGERALQQAAVDELLDDRGADADHQHEQHHRRAARPVDQLLGVLRQPVVGERVRPQLAQRQVHERDEDELGEHADRHADEVDGAEAHGVVLDEVAAARAARRHPHPGEVGDPRRRDGGEQGRDGDVVDVLGPRGGDDDGGHDLSDEERAEPRDDGHRHVDGPAGVAQRRSRQIDPHDSPLYRWPPAARPPAIRHPSVSAPEGQLRDIPAAGPRLAGNTRVGSGGVSRRAGAVTDAVAAVGEAPAERDRQRRGVAPAQVVGVRIALGEELVEPDLRAAVLVGQGHDGALGAPGPGALTERPWHGGEQ